jgi:hypothetical protein
MSGIKPMSMREKTQADFDLEKLFELMDEALTSKDERVQSALRGLLTIIELTRVQEDNKHAIETSHGPLRQMQEDLKNITRRLNNVEAEVRQKNTYVPPSPYTPPYNPMPGAGSPYPTNPGAGSPFGPGIWTTPNTGSPWWGPDPNMPYTTSKSTSSSTFTLTDNDKDSTMDEYAKIKLTK